MHARPDRLTHAGARRRGVGRRRACRERRALIVVDASAVVELLLHRSGFERVADLLLADHQVLHAPHLIDAEVTQVLRRFEQSGILGPGRAAEALADFADLRIVRHPHQPLLERVWALREHLTAYDALYVVLSEALEAPLVTMDARLGRAPAHGARITVVDSDAAG